MSEVPCIHSSWRHQDTSSKKPCLLPILMPNLYTETLRWITTFGKHWDFSIFTWETSSRASLWDTISKLMAQYHFVKFKSNRKLLLNWLKKTGRIHFWPILDELSSNSMCYDKKWSIFEFRWVIIKNWSKKLTSFQW